MTKPIDPALKKKRGRPRGPRPWEELGIPKAQYYRDNPSLKSLAKHTIAEIGDEMASQPTVIGHCPVIDRIEHTGGRMLLFAEALIDKAGRALNDIEIRSVEDLERITRCVTELGRVGTETGRGTVDLRAKMAEIQAPRDANNLPAGKPPIDREAEAQEANPFANLATSNFAQD